MQFRVILRAVNADMYDLIWLVLTISSEQISGDIPGLCPINCLCETTDMIYCDRANFDKIPNYWPKSLRSVHITNSPISTLQKNAFKRYNSLEELVIENCAQLSAIEKFAFKNLTNLRLLRLVNNPSLNEIAKNAFASISSRRSLRIQLQNNSFSVIRSGLFKQISNLRELSITGSNLQIEANAFASLSQVDFFNLFGVVSIAPHAFENISRIHRFEISKSRLSITKGVFSSISHAREIHITSSTLDALNTDGFSGLFTVGLLVLSGNQIGNISGHAFSSIINIGELMIGFNQIDQIDPEALITDAWRINFHDNVIKCNCAIAWMKHLKDSSLLKRNFCGMEQSHRSLINYAPNCSRLKRGNHANHVKLSSHLASMIAYLFIIRHTL